MNPFGIITQRIETIGARTSYLAYFSNCPNEGVVGSNEDEARINLLRLRGPDPKLEWKHNSFFASDEGPWSVTHPEWPGVYGCGGSPQEAYKNWEKSFATKWHRKRLENFFLLIKMLAEQEVDRTYVPDMKAQAQFNFAEVTAFIDDWKAGKIGILRSH